MTAIKKIVDTLENERTPLGNYFLSFIFIIVIRHFLEIFSQISNRFNDASIIIAEEMIHFTLAYIMLAMLLILLLHFATKTTIEKTIRVVLPAFILLWLNPLIDIFFSGKEGVVLLYLQPGFVNDLMYSYFTFFGNFIGGTLGLKCEIFITLIVAYCYLRSKKLNIFFSLFYVWALYSLIFIWGATPYFLQFVKQLAGFHYVYTNDMMMHFYLTINFILGLIITYLANPYLARIFMRDMRFLRILHYELMILFGVAIALSQNAFSIRDQLYFSEDILVNVFLCMISLWFACLFAIINNNIADIKIDQVSNQNRPLIKKVINLNTYFYIGCICLVISLFYASMVSGKAFLLLAVFIASYYLYSTKPLRLKRLFLFSKLAISLNSLVLILLGFLLVQHRIYDFPKVLFFIYLIGFTLSANFIDLKDIKGDSKAHIMTLPIIIGEKSAKILIGIAFWITYISFFYLIQNVYFLILLIIAGGIQFYLINKKNYQESLVLGFYNFGIIVLIAYYLLKKIYFG